MHKTLGGFFEPKTKPQRRNFLKENKINIKRMQQSCDDINKLSNISPSRNSSASLTSKQRPNFITTVNSRHNDKIDHQAKVQRITRKSLVGAKRRQCSKERSKQIETRPSSSMSNLTVRDQSIQTEDDTKEEIFLKDTIIRYPSSTTIHSNQLNGTSDRGSLIGSLKKEGSTHSLGKSVSIRTPSDSNRDDRELIDDEQLEHNNTKNFSDAKLDAKGRNIKSPILDCRKLKNENKVVKESLLIPQNYKMGVVPKYIKDRKEELASIIRQSETIDINCPEGHIPLPEEDRLKALEIAKKRFDTLICELNKMPMTSETLRLRNRKIEIEKELTKLEDSIRIFSRTKVYVKLTE